MIRNSQPHGDARIVQVEKKFKFGGPVKEASLALEEQQQKSKQCGWNIQGRRRVV